MVLNKYYIQATKRMGSEEGKGRKANPDLNE